MFKAILTTAALAAVLAGAGLATSPALRARAVRTWNQVGGWTEGAQQADPVGFTHYAEQKLEQDLQTMRQSRKDLAAEIGQLAQKLREQRVLAAQARSLVEEFRGQYQQAAASDAFPIEVRGAAYTESDARSQVSMLLAEGDGYEQAVAKLAEVKDQAEVQMESLAVRINATETQLAALTTKRELLRTRKLTTEGEQLLAQVDRLLEENAQVIDGNPVRTVQELLETPVADTRATANQARVAEFLAAAAEAAAPAPATPTRSNKRTNRPKPEVKETVATKPVFRQS